MSLFQHPSPSIERISHNDAREDFLADLMKPLLVFRSDGCKMFSVSALVKSFAHQPLHPECGDPILTAQEP